jgi:RND family efflux transporter MFP subunit
MKPKIQKLVFFTLLILALFLPIFGRSYALPKLGKTDNLTYNSKEDQLVTPTLQEIKKEITLTGQIDADQRADLKFQTSGRLAWVGVKVGDRVKKGQALASLDQRELKKTLEKKLNDYLTGLHNFNDVQDEYYQTKQDYLVTDEIQHILDRSQYTLNKTVLDYELQEISLRYATLTTPIAGVVTNIDQPFAGVNVTPATANFTVINPENLYFGAQIDEEDVINVSQDQPAKITIDSFPNQTFDSTISYISFTPLSGQSSVVYDIRFKLDLNNQNLLYRLGMNGDATIILSQQSNALTLPLDALIQKEENSYILVKGDKNQLEERQVETGIESDNFIEITKGIDQNDQIVIKKR